MGIVCGSVCVCVFIEHTVLCVIGKKNVFTSHTGGSSLYMSELVSPQVKFMYTLNSTCFFGVFLVYFCFLILSCLEFDTVPYKNRFGCRTHVERRQTRKKENVWPIRDFMLQLMGTLAKKNPQISCFSSFLLPPALSFSSLTLLGKRQMY